MKLLVFNQQNDLALSESSIRPIIESVLSLEKRKAGEVICHFVTTEVISSLHQDFFDDPSTTDCISFPIDEEEPSEEDLSSHVLGEIFVCPKTAIDYVQSDNASHYYKETTLYLVHGLLHLLGYDDLEEEDQKNMRAAEKRHMDALIQQNLLLKNPDLT